MFVCSHVLDVYLSLYIYICIHTCICAFAAFCRSTSNISIKYIHTYTHLYLHLCVETYRKYTHAHNSKYVHINMCSCICFMIYTYVCSSFEASAEARYIPCFRCLWKVPSLFKPKAPPPYKPSAPSAEQLGESSGLGKSKCRLGSDGLQVGWVTALCCSMNLNTDTFTLKACAGVRMRSD